MKKKFYPSLKLIPLFLFPFILVSILSFYVGHSLQREDLTLAFEAKSLERNHTILSILEYFYSLEGEEQFDRRKAQREALTMVKALYSHEDHHSLWILDHQSRMVLYIKPLEEGGFFPDNAQIISLRELALSREGESRTYESRTRDKTSLISPFEPWQWIIGTTFFKHDLWGVIPLPKALLYSLALGLIIFFFLLFSSKKLVMPITTMSDQLDYRAQNNWKKKSPRTDDPGDEANMFAFNHKKNHPMDTPRELHKIEGLIPLLDAIGTGIIITDKGGYIIQINQRGQGLIHMRLEEVEGQYLGDLFSFMHQKKPVHDFLQQVLKEGKTFGLTNAILLLTKDCTSLPVISTSPIKDRRGEIIGLVLVLTHELLVGKNLLKRYRDLFEGSRDGLVVVDERGRFIDANPSYCQMLGYSLKELKAMDNFYQITPSKWRSWEKEEIWEKRLMKEGYTGIYQKEYRRKDGSIFPVELQSFTVFDEEGAIEYLWGITRDITKRKEAENSLKENKEKLEKLHETAVKMSQGKKEEEICQLLIAATTQILQFTFCKLYLQEGVDLVLKASTIKNPLLIPEEIAQETYQLGKTLLLEANEQEMIPQKRPYPSIISTPIGQLGVFQVIKTEEKSFTQEEIKLVEIITAHSLEAIKSIRSQGQIDHIQVHDHLTNLYNRSYLEEEIKRLDEQVNLPISIIMADVNGLKLINDTYGYHTGDQLLRRAAQILKEHCGETIGITRWGGDEFVMVLPMTSKEEALTICHQIRTRCKGAMVGEVPVQMALGVATKDTVKGDIYQVLKESEDFMNKQKLTESNSARGRIIATLLSTLGEKSDETEEHAWRMQKMALNFGNKIGLPPSELDRLSLLLTLHDIGKITIPEEILTKAGHLTEKEWEIIKQHPETGSRIASSTQDFSHVAKDILHHHERWDGKGYPMGLKGEEIPLLARITTIVDSYDVMTNQRSYKEPLSKKEAIDELKHCSGSQFDPKLLELFLELLKGD